MNQEITQIIESIFLEQKEKIGSDWESNQDTSLINQFQKIILNKIKNHQENIKIRVLNEFNGLGPIESLIDDPEITEILINKHDQIFFEKNGKLFRHSDCFYSEQSYLSMLDRLSSKCGTYLNREKPFLESQVGRMRITIIYSELCRGQNILCIRLQNKSCWTLSELFENKWCNNNQLNIIKHIFQSRKNFLVVGGTGSGKTSFLQALLQELQPNERALIIEDTQELQLSNFASTSLLTRQDPCKSVGDVTMDDLLKRALRLRPDRLVIGEIRGIEARSLMMAMATGHDGCFGSLHARNAEEALLRMEMLIQMGAPQWSLQSIRKLIALTIQNIIVVEKKEGQRQLHSIYEIKSLEENGLTLEKVDQS